MLRSRRELISLTKNENDRLITIEMNNIPSSISKHETKLFCYIIDQITPCEEQG